MTNLDAALTGFRVVHPLDDLPEEKRSPEGRGALALTPAVRFSLMALRSYLLLMVMLVFYRVLVLSGMLA
jgi:hypothetical protein